MPNMTISIPEWLYKKMKTIDWINWSAIARTAFIEKLKEINEVGLMVASAQATQSQHQEEKLK